MKRFINAKTSIVTEALDGQPHPPPGWPVSTAILTPK